MGRNPAKVVEARISVHVRAPDFGFGRFLMGREAESCQEAVKNRELIQKVLCTLLVIFEKVGKNSNAEI
jgi:hypothetical protein